MCGCLKKGRVLPVFPSMSVSVTEAFMLTRRRAGSWLEQPKRESIVANTTSIM